MFQISLDDFDRLLRLQSTPTGPHPSHAFSSGIDAYIVSSNQPRVNDSGVSSHMIGIRDKFDSLFFFR